MNHRHAVLLAILLAFPLAAGTIAAEPQTLVPKEYYGKIAETLATRLPAEHLLGLPLDDNTSRRMWENYLSDLDPGHLFFLESDIETFRKHETTLDDELKKGDIQFAYDVFSVLISRVTNRVQYVDTLLKKGFDFSKEESFVWQRKDEPWPLDEKEWDELWRKRIKNELLSRQVARDVGATEEDSDQDGKKDDENKEKAKNVSDEEHILKGYQRMQENLLASDSEWVMDRYLSSLTQAYDPHCDYMAPRASEEFDIEMKLSLVGIGAVLSMEDGYCTVRRIIPGGPASRDKRDKRLVEKDRIVAVGQGDEEPVDVVHVPLFKTVRLIRGEKGSKVVLRCIPASDPSGTEIKVVDLIRDEVALDEGSATSEIRMVKGPDGKTHKLGVVRLPAFYSDMKAMQEGEKDYKSSSRDVRKILGEMLRESVEGIVLDLRNNGGGSLYEAALMTGLFIEDGPTVLVSRGRAGQRSNTVLPDRDQAIHYAGPLIVLCGRTTASASEILAGALQDYGRAIIVGDSKTHGKGSVQAVVAMGADERLGQIKITNALFYRITGNSTQLKGVTPDIVLSSPLDHSGIGEDYLENPLEFSRIRPIRFAPFADLLPVRYKLIKDTEARWEKSERYATYTNLLQRAEDLRGENEVPLNREKRLVAAKERKKLLDDLEAFVDEQTEKDGDISEKTKGDYVLSETLTILAELCDNFPEYQPRYGVLPVYIDKESIDEETRNKILALIRKLGDKDPEARKSARQGLIEEGDAATPFLQDALDSQDPEIRESVRELLKIGP